MVPRLRSRPATATAAAPPAGVDASIATVAAEMCFELVPLKNVDGAIADLPPEARVSVTCSPVKGIEATTELAARLLDLGHDVIPHVAARMITGPDHVTRIAAWLRAYGVREAFVIGGDAPEPNGPYADAATFLRELLAHDTGLRTIGVAAYPDAHPLIPVAALADALHVKQALVGEAGLALSATTQMCFDATLVRRWLVAARAGGLTMPVVLGVPGVVDRAKLVTMGARLGVGASLRYLRKNRATMTALMRPGNFDPTTLLGDLLVATDGLGVAGIHTFTFNSVAATAAWQQRLAHSS